MSTIPGYGASFTITSNAPERAPISLIGIAAVPIMRELELGPRQFGLLGSSFFSSRSRRSRPAFLFVDRVQTRWVLLAIGFIWALTQSPMMGSVGFETLVACRIALGPGEGPATPVALHSAYKWFPNELRTLPTAVIVQGGAIGVMVALPLLNLVTVRWTWHRAFGSLGLVGLIWCALWLVFGREGSLDNESAKANDAAPSFLRVGYAQLLLSPTVFGVRGGGVRCQLGAVAGALVARRLPDQGSWPSAELDRGPGALPAGGSAVAMLATGWYSQRLLSRDVPPLPGRVLGGAALTMLPYFPAPPSRLP